MKTERLASSYRYGAYKALLENKITENEYETLVEAGGIIDKLTSKLKGLFGGIGPGSEAFKKAAKSKEFNSYLPTAQKGLKDIVANLRKYAGSIEGVDVDKVVDETLMGLLNSAGTTPQELDAAAQSAKSGGGESGGEEVSSGAKIDSAAIEKNPAIAAKAIASATGQPEEKVAAELEKKKPDAAAISAVLGNAVSKIAGVDAKLAAKVTKVFLDKGHLKLKLESNSPVALANLTSIMHRAQKIISEASVLDRWNQLAGFDLNEAAKGPDYSMEYIIKRIENGEIKKIADIPDIIKKSKIKKLSQDQFVKVIDAFEKKNIVKPADEKKAEKELETAMKQLPDSPADAGNKTSAEDEKKAEQVKQKFGPAFKDARSAITPEEADDATLSKIVDAINDLKGVDIAS